jgi:hypothetical protein
MKRPVRPRTDGSPPMLATLQAWARRLLLPLVTTRTELRGLPVTVVNTRTDVDTKAVLARLDAALGLLQRYVPHHFRRLHRDFSGIRVQRHACRGSYLHADRSCVIELTFAVNPQFSPAQIAAVILHEAMHARLHRRGLPYAPSTAARQERFCRRAEIEFGALVPGGEPVVERARAALNGTDEEVAPVVDWTLAEQRVAQADLDAMPMPHWLKRLVARQRGLSAGAEPERRARSD